MGPGEGTLWIRRNTWGSGLAIDVELPNAILLLELFEPDLFPDPFPPACACWRAFQSIKAKLKSLSSTNLLMAPTTSAFPRSSAHFSDGGHHHHHHHHYYHDPHQQQATAAATAAGALSSTSSTSSASMATTVNVKGGTNGDTAESNTVKSYHLGAPLLQAPPSRSLLPCNGFMHRLHCSSFLGLPYGILNISHRKETTTEPMAKVPPSTQPLPSPDPELKQSDS